MAFTRPQLEQYAAKQRDRFEQLLKDFVEIPSVSADPDHKADLERCAELGLATLRAFGGRAEIHRVPGGPPGGARLVRVGQGPADRDRLQPPRRRAGLEGDRALADGALHASRSRATRTSAAARPTTRGRRSPRSSARARRSRPACRSTSSSSGSWRRRSARPTSPTRCGRSAPPRRPTPWSSPTPCGCRAGGPSLSAGLRGLQPLTLPPRDRRRPTSTRARRAAWRATRWPSSRRSPRRSSTPAPAA